MGVKVKVSSILKAPILCNQPKTHSFRAKDHDHQHQYIFKTINSVYFDPTAPEPAGMETPESWFTNTSGSCSFSATEESDDGGGSGELLEAIIRGVQTDRDSSRLFFEPGGETSSLLLEDHNQGGSSSSGSSSIPTVPTSSSICSDHGGDQAVSKEEEAGEVIMSGSPIFEESVAMAMESEDPYLDFRRSMEEMVETNGLMKDDWEGLEELLGRYLSVNGKHNHGYIVSAFVDLLVGINNGGSNRSSSNRHVNSCSCDHHNSEEEESCSSTSTRPCSCSDSRNGGGSDVDDHGHGLGVADGGRRSSASYSSAASFFSCSEVLQIVRADNE